MGGNLMKNREEQGIVNTIQTYLTIKQIPHYRVRNIKNIFFRDGKPQFGRSRFNQNGAPDFFAWHGGKAFAIECKAQKGRLTPDQTEWLNRFKNNGGGEIIVARSLEDVRAGMSI
jgi:Holliday junction resolvase